MTLIIYAVLVTDGLTGKSRSMGSFDTQAEAVEHARSLRGSMFNSRPRVEEVLWSLAPLGRAS
jgi:hypothetical protein